MNKITMFLLMPDIVAGKKLTDLVAESSFFAKIVLLILVTFSVVSWAIIIYKYFELKRNARAADSFVAEFRRRRSLEKSFSALTRMRRSPMSHIYETALVELETISEHKGDRQGPSDNPRRVIDDEHLDHITEAMDRAGTDEMLRLERYVVFLATTANASPFLGLLGTVWGIMESFAQIGVSGTATLAVVAPGIAEALIATVAGLAAAIPALIAYNFYISKLRQMGGHIDNFKSELLSAIKKELTAVA